MILDKLFPKKLKRLAFIPDTHVPCEDKRAFKLVLKALHQFKPDTLYIGGDFGDFNGVSFHEKDPKKAASLKAEVDAVCRALRKVEQIPAKEFIFIEGNHEYRLHRYLAEKAPALFEYINTQDLLKLKDKPWKFIPYKEHVTSGKLSVTHDLGQSGKNAIRGALDSFQHNVIINHVHRMGITYGGNIRGDTHLAACFGWLGDRRNPAFKYMHNYQIMKDWQLGFGIGFMEPNGNVHLQAVPIINYKCVVNGELISG